MAHDLTDTLLTLAKEGASSSSPSNNRQETTHASEENLVARRFSEEVGALSDDGSEGYF
jgi:hypothetical protein